MNDAESPDIVIRGAVPEDVAAVAALELEVYPDAWTPAYLAELVDGRLPTLDLVVAEVDGVVAGYRIGSVVYEMAEVQRITTAPGLRHRGVATALLRDFIALARTGEVERILLEVRASNDAAIKLYVSNDFEQIDRRPRYYQDGEDALVFQFTVDEEPDGPLGMTDGQHG